MDCLLNGVRGIVFDLDGTLLNSTGIWDTVNRATFQRRGLEYPRDYLSRLSGKTAIEAASFTIKEYNFNSITPEELTEQWKDMYVNLFENKADYTTGAIQFVKLMNDRGLPLAIGTASPHAVIDAFFSKRPQDRELFTAIVSCDDVVAGKPNPAVFLECFKRINIDPADGLIFEDSKQGLEAARKSGARVVAMMTGPSPPPNSTEISDYTVSTFVELLENIK